MSTANINTHNLGVGSRVLAGKEFDKHGVIKFIGPTTFSEVQGDWIGICLDTPDGKNNGSHTGVHYFEAEENHGLFVKNWSQVKPEVTEAKPTVKPSVRTSLSTSQKPTSKSETETKTSSSAAILANKEKLAALREKRSQTAAATAANVSPIVPTRPTLNSTKIDVPATPKRMSLSTSRSEVFTTPSVGSEGQGGLTSGKQFPSMCAQDFLDIKTPGKENPLIEMMQASIYKLTKQEDEHVAQITEQNLTIFTLRNDAQVNNAKIDELSTALERATSLQASSDSVIDSLQASVASLESYLAEKTSVSEQAAVETARTVATLSAELGSAKLQVQQLLSDNSQASAMESLQQTVDQLREKDVHSQTELLSLRSSLEALHTRSTGEQQVIAELREAETRVQASLVALNLELGEEKKSAASTQDAHAVALEALQAELSALQTHEKASAAEIAALRASVHTLSEADSSGMCAELQHTIDDLHARDALSAQRVEELQAKITEQQTEISALKANVNQINAAVGNSDSAYAELQRVVDELRASASVQSAELLALQASNTQKDDKIVHLTDTVDGLRVEVSSAEDRFRELSQTVEELHRAQDSALAREDQYLADIERLENDLQDANQQVVSATEGGGAVVSELQRAVEALRLKLSEDRQKSEALQRSLSVVDEELKTKDAQIAELVEQDRSHAETVSSLRNQLTDSEQKVASVGAAESSREKELRSQVDELNESLEVLAMDKEQLMIDNELLEERVLSLQTDLDVYAQGGVGPDGPSSAHLSIETRRLEAALARMQELSLEDKELIGTQSALLEELELECGDLRAYRDQASSDLEEMRGAVDGMSSYEAMIEQLTEQNLELAAQLAASNQLVLDLEESVELNEELDARQTQQISDDRKVIDTLTVTVGAYDRELAERDSAVADIALQMDKLKHANKSLHAEVQLLKDTIQLDSMESRTVESKLRDVALMKTQQELLAQEVNALYTQCIATNAQKFRFQALFVRMDAIFGSSSFYLEESKLVNTEIVFVSTLSTGLDALRLVSSLTSLVVDGKVAVELRDCGSKSVNMFVSLYEHLLRAQYFTIQSAVSLFRDGNESGGRSRVQRLMALKSLFERVSQASLKIVELNSRAAAKNNSARDRVMDSVTREGVEGDGGEGEVLSEEDYAASSSVELQQQVAFDDLAAALSAAMQELREMATQHSDDGTTDDYSFDGEDSVAVPLAQVEMCLLLLNAVADLALFQQQESEGRDTAAPLTPKKQSRKDGAAFSLSEQLKSLKMEIKNTTFSLKQNAAHYVQFTSELEDCCVSLRKSCLTNEENLLSSIKVVLTSLRNINSALSLSSGAGVNITIGVSGILRYFPLILMTNIATSVGAQRQQEESSLREQFAQHTEKYWNLLIQSNSELLVSVDGGAGESFTPTKSSGAGNAASGVAGEVSWKGRVAELRKIVSGRLGSAPAPSLSPKKGASASGAAPFSRDETYFQPQQQVVAAEQHAALVNELDLKKDELKSALRKCRELESLHETALLASVAAAQGAHREEVTKLRGEMKVMEEALKSTENRAEAVEKEARLNRNNHSQSMANVNTPPPKSDRLTRRQSQADVTDAQKSTMSLTSLLPSAGVKEPLTVTAPTHHHHAHDPSAQYQLLLDQVSHWRRVAMKRLTQSLVPLPDLDVLTKSSSSQHDLPVKYSAGNTVRQPNVFSVRNIELVGYDAETSTSADYTALYRKIRLLRAASVRIRPIAGVQTTTSEGPAAVLSKSEALRNRIKAKTNVVYRVASSQ